MNICRHLPTLAAQCLVLLAVPRLQAESAGTVTTTEIKPKAEAAVLYSSVRYQSENRRDPFLNPTLLEKKGDTPDEEVSRGQPPPGISGMFIAQVGLIGVSFRDDSSTAVFQGPDHRAYFLQKGDRLFDGYLKEVGSDFVSLVRETRLKSGKVVTQEVTKRLRTP
jgi:hypothetical protein